MSQAGLLADPAEVRAILISAAQGGQAISYSEVLELLGHHFTRPKMRQLCKVLTFVDEEAEERGEPELAVLVVRQSDGLPGQGWWVGGAKKHGRSCFGRSVAVKRPAAAVHKIALEMVRRTLYCAVQHNEFGGIFDGRRNEG